MLPLPPPPRPVLHLQLCGCLPRVRASFKLDVTLLMQSEQVSMLGFASWLALRASSGFRPSLASPHPSLAPPTRPRHCLLHNCDWPCRCLLGRFWGLGEPANVRWNDRIPGKKVRLSGERPNKMPGQLGTAANRKAFTTLAALPTVPIVQRLHRFFCRSVSDRARTQQPHATQLRPPSGIVRNSCPITRTPEREQPREHKRQCQEWAAGARRDGRRRPCAND